MAGCSGLAQQALEESSPCHQLAGEANAGNAADSKTIESGVLAEARRLSDETDHGGRQLSSPAICNVQSAIFNSVPGSR
jgi:hypothetical protein